MPGSFERMIQLAEEAFAVREDPDQLDVNESVIKRLPEMHPSTVSEFDDNGPAVWILLIPTTTELMHKFLEKEISEKQLYEKTPLHIKYQAIYLCSAMVLSEYRRKGIAKRLTVEAVTGICREHPVKTLFVWPFSKEGDALAEEIAKLCGLPLLKRNK
ncbi:MAG: hypothetical protein ACXVPN_16320 [Bacteroidia bacterium]